MGQREIYLILKANEGRRFKYQEIADVLEIQEKTACLNLNKLARAYPEIKKERISTRACVYLYEND